MQPRACSTRDRNQSPRSALALLALTSLLWAACGGDPEPTSNPGPQGGGSNGPTSAESGVCFGERTACDLPEFVPTTPAEELTVTCTDGADVEVLWSANLGTFDCTVPNCQALKPLVAAGGGRYWTVAELYEPSTDTSTVVPEPVGYAVFAFDEGGQRLHGLSTDVRSRLQSGLSVQSTRSLHVDTHGALTWVAPTVDRQGIELRRYGVDGQASPPQLVAADGILGQARWGADGSAALAYRYPDPLGDTFDPLNQKFFPGIARFDRNGRLLYNQTLLSALVGRNAVDSLVVSSVVVAVAGIGENGEATIRAAERWNDPKWGTQVGSTRFLRLDPKGNVVWARELPSTNFVARGAILDPSTRVLPDGSSLVVHRTVPADPSMVDDAVNIEKLDAEGNSSWRARIDRVELTYSVTAVVDANQRVILSSADSGSSVPIFVFDSNTRACTRHVLQASACEGCSDISLAVVEPDRLYFGMGNRVGVARLP
jgi:hypothetical protein